MTTFRPRTHVPVALFIISSLVTAQPASACVSARRVAVATRHVSYARPVHTVVRPVTVVQPVVQPVVVRPVAPPPVVVAAPAPAPPQHPVVPAGATLTLPANFLGTDPGSVFMVFQEIKLPVTIHAWTMTGVTITLPPMAIKDAVAVRLDIVLPDGRLGHSQPLQVTAPAPVVLHPVAPTSPLPTQAALQTQPAGLFGG